MILLRVKDLHRGRMQFEMRQIFYFFQVEGCVNGYSFISLLVLDYLHRMFSGFPWALDFEGKCLNRKFRK